MADVPQVTDEDLKKMHTIDPATDAPLMQPPWAAPAPPPEQPPVTRKVDEPVKKVEKEEEDEKPKIHGRR